MKKPYLLICITIFILNICSFSPVLSANRQMSDQNLSTQQTQHTSYTQYTPHSNADSLPSGVTKDWLNDLRDENGNRISDRAQGQLPEDPEEDAFQRKIFNGLSASSQFGFSISNAGDVNGDGYDDIIIGAHGYNSFTGRAYIYYGGINMNTTADVTITGAAASSFFGYSVSSAGDVNGDGYSDVVVGAYGYNSNTGRAYIYFGGALMNNTADVIVTGEAVSNFFGISVASAGDMNSDGYSDVLIGASGNSSYTGRAYIYLGGASMNNSADIILSGESANSNFGTSVSSAGDVNADGFSDLIIGATGYNSNTGRAYVYFGGMFIDNIPDVIMNGESVNNYFGCSVSSAEDINGDGYSDIIAGAYGINSFTGKAYIYLGGEVMNSSADVILTGESVLNYFGNSVSAAGDINGDGFSDVIAGAYGFNSNTGKAYIYFGSESMDTTADLSFTGESANNYFGNSVRTCGDVNGDGYPEVIAGAHGYGSFTGRTYIYDYFMKNEIFPELTLTGPSAGIVFGASVSSAGDVNGDGFPDIIAGAPAYSSNTGRAYIFFGGISMDNNADIILTGEAISNLFGGSVSSAGDVNGDGFSDVIVGANAYSANTGRTYIYFGGSVMDNTADVIMTGVSTYDFGTSVSSAGDVNGDGFSDVIVGADGYFNVRGKAFIYLGGISMDNVSDVTLLGDSLYSYIGHSVSSAGDVNGDGYSDVIVGNPSSLNSYYGFGEAYIFFGGAFMNSTKDVTLLGESYGSGFGKSVSSADLNSDGYSDVIVGSGSYNAGAGRSYIFYGGGLMDNWADVVMSGEYGSSFGNSVSSAGDMNGDGYPDVIVGAPGYSSGSGRSYIFLGGISMDNQTDITLTGDPYELGISVSSAGDINGDGYSDVIAGADSYSSNTGRAYIYTGSAISIKPIFIYARDVPNDQGGKLNLKWARSANDVQGNSLITDYLIQRSFPPSGGNFSWQNVTAVTASHESFYTYVDQTPSDSTSGGSSTFFYRITARTNSINQYWRSIILSGRSLDNISPPVVSPFNAFSESSNVRLTWKRNSAPDLLNYVLFRSVSSSIDPYTETPLTSLSDSTYLDTAPLSGLYYYFIVAQDIHNNYSPVAVAQAPVSPKNLLMYGAIQGLYNSTSNTMIYDTVTVYLRNAVSPFAKVDSSKKLLYGPGTGQEFSFNNVQNGTPYYIEVKHRNALETWSADPVTFAGDAASIAFSVDAVYAYGSNQIQVDNNPYNVFAFYSGDVNGDGTIDLTDVIQIYNGAGSFVTGYTVTDLTGDLQVDLTDLLIAYNNSISFVSVVRP